MRRIVCLIWLCAALIPLRGMAHAFMIGGDAGHGSVAAAADESAPCPSHAAADAASSDAQSPAPMGHTCQLCGVCHSVALLSLSLVAPAPCAPHEAPQSCAGLGAGRAAPDKLFRPPR